MRGVHDGDVPDARQIPKTRSSKPGQELPIVIGEVNSCGSSPDGPRIGLRLSASRTDSAFHGVFGRALAKGELSMRARLFLIQGQGRRRRRPHDFTPPCTTDRAWTDRYTRIIGAAASAPRGIPKAPLATSTVPLSACELSPRRRSPPTSHGCAPVSPPGSRPHGSVCKPDARDRAL